MKKLLLLALLLFPTGAFAQASTVTCNPALTETAVLSSFADNVPGGITPRNLRDYVCSSISFPTTPLNLNLTQAMSGAATLYNWNTFTTTSDTQGCNFCTDINVTHMFGGATHRGAHEGLFSWVIQTAVNTGGGLGPTVAVPIAGIGQSNVGDGGTAATAQGTYFGANLICRNSGTNALNCYSSENDLETQVGSSMRYGFAQALVNYEATQATSADAAIGIYSGGSIAAAGGAGPWGPGIGFHNGILFAELSANGLVPIDSTGSVLSTHLESLSNIPVSYGIDLRGFSVTNCAFASVNFCIGGNGNAQIANATSRSNAMDIGSDTGTNNVRINGGSASSTGAVISFCESGTCLGQIGFPSAVLGGAFDFNIGIFGFSGLKFFTNNTLAWAIDTTGALSGAHIVGSGTAPTCSSTALGAQGTCTLATGSSDLVGVTHLTASGAGIGASGNLTLTLHASLGSHGTSCIWNPAVTSSGTWTAPAITVTSSSSTAPTAFWNNNSNATNLTSGSTYDLNYHCLGF